MPAAISGTHPMETHVQHRYQQGLPILQYDNHMLGYAHIYMASPMASIHANYKHMYTEYRCCLSWSSRAQACGQTYMDDMTDSFDAAKNNSTAYGNTELHVFIIGYKGLINCLPPKINYDNYIFRLLAFQKSLWPAKITGVRKYSHMFIV